MKKTPLSRFESMAQRLIEGSFRRLLGSRLDPLELWTAVSLALEQGLEAGKPASLYQVHLHPDDYQAILAERPLIQDELATYLLSLMQKAQYHTTQPPTVMLVADILTPPRRVSIETGSAQPTRSLTTQLFQRKRDSGQSMAALHAIDAFLIVAGRQHVPLNKPVIHIGRRMENDIVLDSPSVSRNHAQIRWRQGHFVLYDLSNRGRTAVNEQPISEHVLKPGDVIQLSNVALIYGEGGEWEERPFDPTEPDEQTLALRREDEDKL